MSLKVESPPFGSLDVPYLFEIWERYTSRSANQSRLNWHFVKLVLEGLGLALEETLQYLGRRLPTFIEFEQWIRERNDGEIEPLRLERLRAAIEGRTYGPEVAASIQAIDVREPVLSPEDLSFWEENGYVILHEAISAAACRATELAVWDV